MAKDIGRAEPAYSRDTTQVSPTVPLSEMKHHAMVLLESKGTELEEKSAVTSEYGRVALLSGDGGGKDESTETPTRAVEGLTLAWTTVDRMHVAEEKCTSATIDREGRLTSTDKTCTATSTDEIGTSLSTDQTGTSTFTGEKWTSSIDEKLTSTDTDEKGTSTDTDEKGTSINSPKQLTPAQASEKLDALSDAATLLTRVESSEKGGPVLFPVPGESKDYGDSKEAGIAESVSGAFMEISNEVDKVCCEAASENFTISSRGYGRKVGRKSGDLKRSKDCIEAASGIQLIKYLDEVALEICDEENRNARLLTSQKTTVASLLCQKQECVSKWNAYRDGVESGDQSLCVHVENSFNMIRTLDYEVMKAVADMKRVHNRLRRSSRVRVLASYACSLALDIPSHLYDEGAVAVRRNLFEVVLGLHRYLVLS